MERSDEPTVHDEISLDRSYRLLANARRRYVIECLEERSRMSLPDLAEYIACRERNEPITAIPEDELTRIYVSLWHRHVPKLAEAGVIDYEADTDEVMLHSDRPPLPGYPNAADEKPGRNRARFPHPPGM